MWTRFCAALGRVLARFLSKPNTNYMPLATTEPGKLATALRSGDVLLVEGNSRISTAIKYLTQSTWSHAALYVGPEPGDDGADPPVLIEADVELGVIAVPLSKYAHMHTRICRPVNLTAADAQQLIRYAREQLGRTYDLQNVFDLARYLLRTPPVPTSWRRRMLMLGSGEPTKAICSTLVAQAFQTVKYPILPRIIMQPDPDRCNDCVSEIMEVRHHSLFAPRDFDLSPYFEVVKPTIVTGFDYRTITWDDTPVELTTSIMSADGA